MDAENLLHYILISDISSRDTQQATKQACFFFVCFQRALFNVKGEQGLTPLIIAYTDQSPIQNIIKGKVSEAGTVIY